MGVVVHHLALVLAVAALADGSVRLASLAAPRGLERVVAAAVIAAAAAILATLALGLAGLGASPLALVASALACSALARALLPAPARAPRGELAAAARAAGVGRRAAVGAVAGLLVACVAYCLRHPALDVDSVAYHLPEVLGWIRSGHAGAIVQPAPQFQTGWYPLTNEIALSWAIAIARSFVPVALWMGFTVSVLLASAWLALRRLGAPALVAALAIAAVVVSPDFARELNTAKNDGAALAWLLASGALTLAAGRDRPRLFAVALVAAALAIGTKTTTAPLVLAVLAVGAVRMRVWEARPLAAALAVAVAVGGVWYLRDFVLHGSPLWPELAAPWGTPIPPALARIHVSLLDRPLFTLRGRVSQYLDLLGGNVLLLAGGALCGLAVLAVRRRADRRAVAATGVACAAGILLWAAAPFTGRADNAFVDLSLTVTRYLLPAVACGALALALAARAGGWTRHAIVALLAGAIAWSAAQTALLPAAPLPGAGVLLAGAVGGALVAVAAAGVVRLRVAWAATAVAGALVLAAQAGGYVARMAAVDATFASPLARWFLTQPRFRDGSAPIALMLEQVAVLAGDRLRHPVDLLSGRETCAELVERARRGWVVVRVLPAFALPLLPSSTAPGCLAATQPVFAGASFRVYRFAA